MPPEAPLRNKNRVNLKVRARSEAVLMRHKVIFVQARPKSDRMRLHI
jgi:hypothetical protein